MSELDPRAECAFDEIVERFETAWNEGHEPEIDDYLPEDESRDELLEHLVHIDLEYRVKAGYSTRAQDYLDRYPELSRDEETANELLESELRFQRYRDAQNRRYYKKEWLAEGGLGTVFVADDTELNRNVALKELREEYVQQPYQKAAFEREAEIAAALEHPGTVPTYGRGESPDGRPFYAMRLLEGDTFEKAIVEFHGTRNRKCRFTRRQREFHTLLRHLNDVCNAIHYAHSRGIVHRDIKPRNIMLGEHGESLVVDWGLAKVLGGPAEERTKDEPNGVPVSRDIRHTQTDDLVGTLQFMSPEQAGQGFGEIGPATDVYGLGATLYFILTGQPPHAVPDRNDDDAPESGNTDNSETTISRGQTVRDGEKSPFSEALERIQNGDFRRPHQIKTDVPRPLEAICLRAMATKPESRYASPHDMADEIEHWLADEPVGAFRENAFERLGRWGRRHRTWVRAGSAALVLVAVISIVAYVLVSVALKKETKALGEAVTQRERAKEAQRKEEEARQKAEKTARDLERALRRSYIGGISWAESEWLNNRPKKTEAILLDCPRALCGWEWHYLMRRCRSDLMTIRGVPREEQSVHFSSDGKYVTYQGAMWGWDVLTGERRSLDPNESGRLERHSPNGRYYVEVNETEIAIHNAETGKQVHLLTEARGAAAFSPDSRHLATGNAHGAITIWDTATGSEALTFDNGNMNAPRWIVSNLAYSPDGRLIASANFHGWTINIWDASTGKTIRALSRHDGIVTDFEFHPDGTQLASCGEDGAVRLWDLSNGREVRGFRGHDDAVNSVSFSPDGHLIASTSADGTLKVWDPTNDQGAVTLGKQTRGYLSVDLSPNGTRVVASSAYTLDKPEEHRREGHGEISVFEAETGREILAIENVRRFHNDARYSSVAFHPDGKQFAAGCHYESSEQLYPVKVWDAATGAEVLSLEGHTRPIRSVAFSPNGKWIASSSEHALRIWDAATGKEERVLTADSGGILFTGITSAAFGPQSRRIAAAGYDGVAVCDVDSGQKLFAIEKPREAASVCSFTGVAFSRAGRFLATSISDPPQIDIWNADNGERISILRGHEKDVTGVAFSPDGIRLASSSEDGTIKIWDVREGLEILTLHGHNESVNDVTFSRDGKRLVSASGDGTIRIWDARTDPEIPTLRGHAEPITGFAFDSTGAKLATTSFHDNTMRVWDATKLEETAFIRHDDPPPIAAFSPANDSLLASMSYTNIGRIWNVTTGAEAIELKPEHENGPVYCMAFNPDGRLLATAGDGEYIGDHVEGSFVGRVVLWNAKDGKRLVGVGAWEANDERAAAGVHGVTAFSVAFHPNGGRFAYGCSDKTVRVCEILDMEKLLPGDFEVEDPPVREDVLILRHEAAVRSVTYSPDGQLLASADASGTLKVHNAVTGKDLYSRELAGDKVVFDPVGKRLATAGSDMMVIIWDATNGKPLLRLDDAGSDVLFSPDGKHIATIQGSVVKYWDLESQLPVWQTQRRAACSERLTRWHQLRAEASIVNQQWFAAVFHLNKLIPDRPNDADAHADLGFCYAKLGKPEEAAAECKKAIELKASRPIAWKLLADQHLRRGDLESYRQTCASMVAHFGDTEDAKRADMIAWHGSLLPNTISDAKCLVELAERAVATYSYDGLYLETLGAALYRNARYEQAVEKLKEALEWHKDKEPVCAWLFMAMAHKQLGQTEEAQAWLGKAAESIDEKSEQLGDQGAPTASTSERTRLLEAELLRREAESLFGRETGQESAPKPGDDGQQPGT